MRLKHDSESRYMMRLTERAGTSVDGQRRQGYKWFAVFHHIQGTTSSEV